KLHGGLSTNSATATVTGTPNENGSFTPDYRFADAAGNSYFRNTSISIANGSSTITVSGSGFNGYDLGTASTGVAYSNTFFANGGGGTFTWTLANGALPPGLSISTSGVVNGTPTVVGSY